MIQFLCTLFLCIQANDAASQNIDSTAPAFQVIAASGRVERSLRQYEALLADEAWNEAIELIETLHTEHGDELVVLRSEDEAWNRYETVAVRCQRMLALLEADALNQYRRGVDRSAQREVDEGIRNRDEPQLLRVVNDYFASSWTDEALHALAELALQRGDTAAARRYLGMLHRELWGFYGEPAAHALSGVSPGADPNLLAQAWFGFKRPANLTICPSPSKDIAAAIARCAFASVLEGDPHRAEIECALLEALAPGAEGRFAGKNQLLAPALRDLISSMYAESVEPDRLPAISQWLWETPIESPNLIAENQRSSRILRMMQQHGMANQLRQLQQQGFNPRTIAGQGASPLPQVVAKDQAVFFINESDVNYLDLATGEMTQTPLAEILGFAQAQQPTSNIQRRQFGVGGLQIQIVQGRANANQRIFTRAVPGTHLIHQGVLYGVHAQNFTKRGPQGPEQIRNETLYGLDLHSDLKLTFQLKSEQLSDESELRFASAPQFFGDHVIVALTSRSATGQVAVGCYKRDGQRLWLTQLGSGRQVVGWSQPTAMSLGIGPDTAYLSTNYGAVAAISLREGRVRWIARYERAAMKDASSQILDYTPRPIILRGDQLFVAPSDSPGVLALSATTGRVLWRSEVEDPSATLLGLTGGSLVVGGRSLELLDPLSGRSRFTWPESNHAGIRGMGRGLVHGEEVFWPTRDTLYSLSARTGAMSRSPIDISSLGSHGVNLALAGDRLVLIGASGVNVLGDSAAEREEPKPQLSRLNRSAPEIALAQIPSSP